MSTRQSRLVAALWGSSPVVALWTRSEVGLVDDAVDRGGGLHRWSSSWQPSPSRREPDIDSVNNNNHYRAAMMLSHFVAVLSTALVALGASTPQDTFHESLTLHPLPDGKLSVLFEFTTHFNLHKGSAGRTRKLASPRPQANSSTIAPLAHAADAPPPAREEQCVGTHNVLHGRTVAYAAARRERAADVRGGRRRRGGAWLDPR